MYADRGNLPVRGRTLGAPGQLRLCTILRLSIYCWATAILPGLHKAASSTPKPCPQANANLMIMLGPARGPSCSFLKEMQTLAQRACLLVNTSVHLFEQVPDSHCHREPRCLPQSRIQTLSV